MEALIGVPPMPEDHADKNSLVVVGGGPAGLTAALEAQQAGIHTVVIEKDPDYVGGISRTVQSGGYRFDIGGHRFFSKSDEIVRWWKARLPKDFIRVRRMSRIYYRHRYFDYPLRPWNALSNLGVVASLMCMASYVWVRLFPVRPEASFEDWVTNRFGRRLFNIFFKTYTEKVWGTSTRQLSADWAAQRIKGLSLSKAVLNAFRRAPKTSGEVIKTLIDTFDYPRFGPGQMWEQTARDLQHMGGEVALGWKATIIRHQDGRVTEIEARRLDGSARVFAGANFIVSMPLQETVLAFEPGLPAAVVTAAKRLRYRDFLTVALVVEGPNPFPDNWIYIHEPGVKLGRIQNFKNWSEAMIGRVGTTCLGLEYFCFEGDGLWSMPDTDLVELGKKELIQLGLAKADTLREGVVVRVEKAYPIYDPDYQSNLTVIRAALAQFPNLQVVGRNGMHKYNNQDHSMMTALLAVRNLQGGAVQSLECEYRCRVSRRGSPRGRVWPNDASIDQRGG